MLFVWVLEWVWDPRLWIYDQGTINCGPEPGNMSMPKEGALLPHHCELICESLTRLNRALGDIRRSVEPA
jgi:hypothetical protein